MMIKENRILIDEEKKMKENFLKFGLDEQLAVGLEKMGFEAFTQIQAEVLPVALTGKNIIGKSATGTGKTLAYLLPIVQKIEMDNRALQAVVLAPTYELAMQIYRQLELLMQKAEKKITIASLIGGANISRQVDKLKNKPQIVVGSVGRILELQKKGKLQFKNVKMVVLDEADRMVDDQNFAMVRQFVKQVPVDVQYMLFSATISRKTFSKADEFAKEPVEILLKDETTLSENILHSYFLADFRDKIDVLRKITRGLEIKRGLVFVNKTHDIKIVTEKLLYHGLKVGSLAGDANKIERKKAIDDFTKGKVTLMIASDVAARGLDIPDIDFVIHHDVGDNESVYTHRAGRTGRAGKKGQSISLVAPKEIKKISDFAERLQIEIKPKQLLQGKIVDFRRRPTNRNHVKKENRNNKE